MAAPLATLTFPNDLDTGTPVGSVIEITFDRGIDLDIAKKHVVLYGNDFDMTSGPDSALWLDQGSGDNPFFLRSPGFKGLTESDFELVYINKVSGLEADPGVITSESDELAAFAGDGAAHRLKLTPKSDLAPDSEYKMYVIGDPDSIGQGIASRTVFDVVPDVGNTSITGFMHNYGGYTELTADSVVVEIMKSGNIGAAEFRWYYTSAGVGTAKTGLVTNRRHRRLQDGLQIRFSGSSFVLGDLYTFGVEPATRMVASFIVTFTTNDGSFTTAPVSPSTPATSLPPASVLPPGAGLPLSTDALLYIEEMLPLDGAYNVDLNTRQITITFDDPVDAATVTQSTLRVWKYPVSGVYQDTSPPVELLKKITVSGNQVIIDI